jgi:DNA primase
VTPDAKVKALNFLLPHMQHIPSRIARDEFAADAAQKLAIDSALLRQELKQAALKRTDSVGSSTAINYMLSDAEKILLQVLSLPQGHSARQLAYARLNENPDICEGLVASAIITALLNADEISNPLDLAPDEASRNLLANVLMKGPQEMRTEHVEFAFHALRRSGLERRQLELRRLLEDAQARRDQDELRKLTMEKMALDRALEVSLSPRNPNK